MNRCDLAVPDLDFQKVLVVAKSAINRIVIAKIVERAGLTPVVMTPEAAGATLPCETPGTIVLDGGADNRDCDNLIPAVTAAREAAGGRLPAVIMLCNRIGTPAGLGLPAIVNVVVAKPITPEKLQPVIERLLSMARS